MVFTHTILQILSIVNLAQTQQHLNHRVVYQLKEEGFGIFLSSVELHDEHILFANLGLNFRPITTFYFENLHTVVYKQTNKNIIKNKIKIP